MGCVNNKEMDGDIKPIDPKAMLASIAASMNAPLAPKKEESPADIAKKMASGQVATASVKENRISAVGGNVANSNEDKKFKDQILNLVAGETTSVDEVRDSFYELPLAEIEKIREKEMSEALAQVFKNHQCFVEGRMGDRKAVKLPRKLEDFRSKKAIEQDEVAKKVASDAFERAYQATMVGGAQKTAASRETETAAINEILNARGIKDDKAEAKPTGNAKTTSASDVKNAAMQPAPSKGGYQQAVENVRENVGATDAADTRTIVFVDKTLVKEKVSWFDRLFPRTLPPRPRLNTTRTYVWVADPKPKKAKKPIIPISKRREMKENMARRLEEMEGNK